MSKLFQIFNQVLPILLLLLLGFTLRRFSVFSARTVGEFKKLVVNVALPALLFVSFMEIELKADYLPVMLLIFVLCILLFLLGKLLVRLGFAHHDNFPYLMTGFEYGMLGVSVFGSVYGMDKIGYIAVVDLGHEAFIWFIFIPLLIMRRDGKTAPRDVILSILKSPVIMGLGGGIACNLLGLHEGLRVWPLTGGLMTALEFLGAMTIPLVLIILGYGIHFERSGFGDVLKVAALRAAIVVPLALALNHYVLRGWLGLPPGFEAGLFTLFIMPPSYGIPLFTRDDHPEMAYVNNTLTLYTFFSIIAFTIYLGFVPSV